MRIEAHYMDGLTEPRLDWDLVVDAGMAYLEAARSRRRKPPLHARFRFDDGPFRAVLPRLCSMGEEYQAPWDDLELRDLMVRHGETTIRRRVYGASVLVAAHPEIEDFLAAWRLLETAVMAHLPAPSGG
jgi:hypothetical protein